MELIKPWDLIDLDKQDFFNIELSKELYPSHILYHSKLNAIAKNSSNDDVLYAFVDGTFRVADVHLSWKQNVEVFPYPVSIIYCSFEKWKATVIYENILPPMDYSSTICVIGYFLIEYFIYEDYFKWAENLVNEDFQSSELDIFLGYSLDENLVHIEFLNLLKMLFVKLDVNINDIKQCLFSFMNYLCDRIISNIEQLDDVVRVFKKLYYKYIDEYDFLEDWKKLSIDLYYIYTYENPVYFVELTLENYHQFVIQFAKEFKDKLVISQSKGF